MLDLPVSLPTSPYDFLALIETYRHHLDQLDYAGLSVLYGLSCLEPFQDEAFCQEVESYLASNPDPVRARYEVAYALASRFWESFSNWQYRPIDSPEGRKWEEIKEGEPGYVGDFPDRLRKTIMRWLLAGIEAYREDDELMQLIRWLKYRLVVWDTSLSEAEIQVLEQALGEEIDFRKDQRAQAIIQQNLQALEEYKERNEEE